MTQLVHDVVDRTPHRVATRGMEVARSGAAEPQPGQPRAHDGIDCVGGGLVLGGDVVQRRDVNESRAAFSHVELGRQEKPFGSLEFQRSSLTDSATRTAS